jgi:hypothetical protein
MDKSYSKFLRKVAIENGWEDLPAKKAFMNPMENDMHARLIMGALKGLEMVALASFDIKLTAIIKMLQVWAQDKKNEADKQKQITEYGAASWDDSGYPNNVYNPGNFY